MCVVCASVFVCALQFTAITVLEHYNLRRPKTYGYCAMIKCHVCVSVYSAGVRFGGNKCIAASHTCATRLKCAKFRSTPSWAWQINGYQRFAYSIYARNASIHAAAAFCATISAHKGLPRMYASIYEAYMILLTHFQPSKTTLETPQFSHILHILWHSIFARVA